MPALPRVIGGPAMGYRRRIHPGDGQDGVRRTRQGQAKNPLTVGIVDDVTHSSLEVDPGFIIEVDQVVRAMFFLVSAQMARSA